jgi:hypothetical protein
MDLKQARTYLEEKGSDRLRQQLTTGFVTPIPFAEALGVRPQMIYGYIRDGRIASTVTADTQKRVLTVEAAVEFTAKYFTDKAEREEKRKAKIEAELAGEANNA